MSWRESTVQQLGAVTVTELINILFFFERQFPLFWFVGYADIQSQGRVRIHLFHAERSWASLRWPRDHLTHTHTHTCLEAAWLLLRRDTSHAQIVPFFLFFLSISATTHTHSYACGRDVLQSPLPRRRNRNSRKKRKKKKTVSRLLTEKRLKKSRFSEKEKKTPVSCRRRKVIKKGEKRETMAWGVCFVGFYFLQV